MRVFSVVQVDSLKKLRWYDRDDLSQLVEITTREKQQLHDTIAALRQVRHCPIVTLTFWRHFLNTKLFSVPRHHHVQCFMSDLPAMSIGNVRCSFAQIWSAPIVTSLM